jgi:polyisoprenoid-binding protein YceI
MKLHKNLSLATLALLLGGATAVYAQTTTYNIDPMHSEADFSILHMDLSHVHGQFSHITGTIVLDTKDMSKSSVQATIPVDTVDTGVSMRDKDLKGPDFFDVAKFPTMTFQSTSVTPDSGGYKVAGNLTLHGVTKPVTLQMDPLGQAISMHGQMHRGFQATTSINRKDFGLKWNGMMPNGDAMIGNNVKITLDVEAAAK